MFELFALLILGMLGFVASVFVFGAILAFPTMWLWNWLVPELFHLSTISFWQAWGLLLLSGILIKSGSSSSSSSSSSSKS